MDMKAIDRIAIVAFGFLCMTIAACTKVEIDSYSDYAWTGEYPIKTQNGTTGEMEDHTGVIMLQFQNGGMECFVNTGISGMYGMNCRKYEALTSTNKPVNQLITGFSPEKGPKTSFGLSLLILFEQS